MHESITMAKIRVNSDDEFLFQGAYIYDVTSSTMDDAMISNLDS